MRKKKKSPSGDNNWLRTFYQLCGLDSTGADIAIARRDEEDPPQSIDGARGLQGTLPAPQHLLDNF
jgi:hypothetical protein